MELDLVVTKAPAVLRPKAREGTLCPSPHRQHFCCLELLQGESRCSSLEEKEVLC